MMPKPSESLADRAARLRRDTAAFAKQHHKDARYSRVERMREDVRLSGRFAYQASQGALWLYDWLLCPLLRFCAVKTRWLWRIYHRLWSLAVYCRTPDDVLLFSKTRAGLMLAATFVFFWFIALPVLDAGYEGLVYLLTAQVDERVYLLGSQEINSTTGSHIIEGCSALPCSDQDAIYFRTENSLFNNLWSLAHGRGIFYPEYVGAAVPYSTSHCVVTSYGFRVRLPFRLANTYSYMLAVTCQPIREPR